MRRRPNRSYCLPALAGLALAACEPEPSPEAPASPPRADAPAVPAPVAAETAPAAPAAAAPAATPPRLPPAPPGPWSAKGYRLVGTEPFWGGTVSRDTVLYQTPDDQAGTTVAVTASYAAGRETYSGTLAGKRFVLSLSKGPCSDGMSDNVHAFTAELVVAGETRHGCANPR